MKTYLHKQYFFVEKSNRSKEVWQGKFVIRGTRIPIDAIFGRIAEETGIGESEIFY